MAGPRLNGALVSIYVRIGKTGYELQFIMIHRRRGNCQEDREAGL